MFRMPSGAKFRQAQKNKKKTSVFLFHVFLCAESDPDTR